MNHVKSKKNELKLNLKQDEQITFKFLSNCEFDFVVKDWGAYVTPSLFKRCKKFRLKAALILEIKINKINLVFVKRGKEKIFLSSLKKNKNVLIFWLRSYNFIKNNKI